MSRTLEIPVKAIFGNVAAESAAYLDIACPGLEPRTVSLGRTDILLGRDEDCQICLPAPNVSRKHSMLSWNGEDYIIEDLDSTNGTFVNNVNIRRCVLRNNDQISIGLALIVFSQHRAAEKT
jgi:pSer/pThr/pTyr-binding forkhead associated (FHA) protein